MQNQSVDTFLLSFSLLSPLSPRSMLGAGNGNDLCRLSSNIVQFSYTITVSRLINFSIFSSRAIICYFIFFPFVFLVRFACCVFFVFLSIQFNISAAVDHWWIIAHTNRYTESVKIRMRIKKSGLLWLYYLCSFPRGTHLYANLYVDSSCLATQTSCNTSPNTTTSRLK